MEQFGTKVLVVDDYAMMRRVIRNLLQQIGFKEIDEAADGTSALEKLASGDFGLVLSDWNMEPMSGLELVKQIRSDARLKELPFIMVTAESKAESVIAAKQAGISNYVVKPFNTDTLKKKIESVIGSSAPIRT